jgi:hypothetical protein
LPNEKGELVFAPSVNYQDRFYTGPLARLLPLSEAAVLGQYDEIAHGGGLVPGYTTVDLRVEWNSIMGSRIDGAVNVLNSTNRLYFLGNPGDTLNIGAQSEAYGPPHMINVEFSTKF